MSIIFTEPTFFIITHGPNDYRFTKALTQNLGMQLHVYEILFILTGK